MQIDLVPQLSPSGGYQNMVTVMNVASRYLFVYSTANQEGETIARVTIEIMMRQAYLLTTNISDKRTAFVSQVIKKVADVPGITKEHATTKHAQTIGMLGKTHASLK